MNEAPPEPAVEPTTAPKFFCFVLMPFDPEFRDVYEIGIKEGCQGANAYCERLDEQLFAERMLDRIYNQIARCDLVIADMTGRNANVFYEVGYAHALNKPTLLLTKDASDIPFDLKHFPHVVYGGSLKGLRDEVERRVKWFVENPRSKTQGKHDVELYLGSVSLAAGGASFTAPSGRYPRPIVTLINGSGRIMQPAELKVGVISSRRYVTHSFGRDQGSYRGIELPDGRLMHIWGSGDMILPSEPVTIDLAFQCPHDAARPHEETFVYRVFTESGTRDYPLRIVESADPQA